MLYPTAFSLRNNEWSTRIFLVAGGKFFPQSPHTITGPMNRAANSESAGCHAASLPELQHLCLSTSEKIRCHVTRASFLPIHGRVLRFLFLAMAFILPASLAR